MIDGRTRLIAHLGVPTETFRAPSIYNPWFRHSGVNAVVVPMGVEAADFPEFLRPLFRLRNIAGALVTMPHKVTAAALVDSPSPAVEICGACNAIRRGTQGELIGEMFDGEGFRRGLVRRGRRIDGASALVVGAGGVGSAIAASLAGAGLSRLALFDTRQGVADALAARLHRHFPALSIVTTSADPAGHGIVVNATPLGGHDADALPLDPARLDAGAFVGDVVLARDVTPLLERAMALGCETQTGADMLYEQIPAYLDFFGFGGATAEALRRVVATEAGQAG